MRSGGHGFAHVDIQVLHVQLTGDQLAEEKVTARTMPGVLPLKVILEFLYVFSINNV